MLERRETSSELLESTPAPVDLHALIETMPDAYVLLAARRDEAGTIIDFTFQAANDRACRLNNLSRAELLGSSLLALHPAVLDSGLFERYCAALETGVPVVLTDWPYPQETLSGEMRWYDVHIARYQSAIGQTWRDVTDRHAAEEALAVSEARLRAAMESDVDGHFFAVGIRDATGTITDFRVEDANAATAGYFGRPLENVIGHRFRELVPPDVAEEAVGAYRDVMETSTPMIRDHYPVVRNGNTTWLDVHAVSASDGVSVSWRDITDRVEAEEALASAAAKYQALAEVTADVQFKMGPDGVISWVSDSITHVLGYDPDEITGQSAFTFIAYEADSAHELLTRPELVGERLQLVRKDGVLVWVEIFARAVRDADGQTTEWLGGWRGVDADERIRQAREAEAVRTAAVLATMIDPHVLMEAVRDSDGQVIDFTFLEANVVALEYLGMTLTELRATSLTRLYPSAAAHELRDMYTRTVETGEALIVDDYSYPNELWQGEERHYDLRGVRLGDGLSLTWRDVTDRHLEEKRLADSEARFRLLAENTSDVVWQADDHMNVLWVSPSIRSLLDRPEEDLLGAGATRLMNPADLPSVRRAIEESNRTGGDAIVRYRMKHRNGTYVWVEAAGRPYVDPITGAAGRVVRLRNVDAQVRSERELRKTATLDALTGLLNRHEFINRLQGVLDHPPRAGRSMGLLYLDLDSLKRTNDTLGHGAGDALLMATAARIRDLVRTGDLVGRIGGDEMLVLLGEIGDASDLTAIAEKLRNAICQPVPGSDDAPIVSTVSIGATVVRPEERVDALIQRADAAMYSAKRMGGNSVVLLD